jgi:hypothetical protein
MEKGPFRAFFFVVYFWPPSGQPEFGSSAVFAVDDPD